MGFFDFLKSKKNYDIDNLLLGWLRSDTMETSGLDASMVELLAENQKSEVMALFQKVDDSTMRDTANLFISISPSRSNELLGSFIINLWFRYLAVLNAHMLGKIEKSDTDVNKLAIVLLGQTKQMINRLEKS